MIQMRLRIPPWRFQLLLGCLLLTLLPTQATATVIHYSTPRAAAAQPPATDFLTPPAAGDPGTIALGYLRANASRWGLTQADLADLVVKDRYRSAHNGVTHLYLRQRFHGIEVFGGDLSVHVTRDGRVLSVGNRLLTDLAQRITTQSPTLNVVAAVEQSAAALGVPVTEKLVASGGQGIDQRQLLSTGGVSAAPIPAQLIYQPLPSGELRLAWQLVLRLPAREQWLSLRTDAVTGDILSQVDWSSHAHTPAQPLPPAHYLAYGLPAESPLAAERTLLSNPADPVASPFGWHDTNGVAGPEFTTTQGNNTFTYADLVAPNGYGVGDYTTDTEGTQIFSHTVDLAQSPATYRDAALTNLFYTTNMVHDLLYHYGFDEAAGNFQITNYTGQGLGNDAVKAEGQDYAGIMNANFATPPDGTAPVMQMYLGDAPRALVVHSPAVISGEYRAVNADFGPVTFQLTGAVVVVDDGDVSDGGTVSDGCQLPFHNQNDLVGKIALLDQGPCSFGRQVWHAEQAGAMGALVIHHGESLPLRMAADPRIPTPVTMGALLIEEGIGATLKAQLALSTLVNSTLQRGAARDGALDNGVIIHEYGHGLSMRLTGGPSNSHCLSTSEAGGLSEGWSDFLALAFTAHATDVATTPRTIGRWLFGQGADGPGIRRYPYTTALAANPLTFAATTQPDPVTGLTGELHKVGEVWATMLWELYWQLVNQQGFGGDLVNGTGGNQVALQLVIDGMKLQPCNPTFVEARDAILAADLVNNQGANQCVIWRGFAKRGLGASASAGSNATVADGVEAFDLPSSCLLTITPRRQAICHPAPVHYTVAAGVTTPLTLTLSPALTGTVSNFAPNPLPSFGQSSLTLSTTTEISRGWQLVTVQGVDTTAAYTATAAYHLAASPPITPLLQLPRPDAVAVIANPTFHWRAAPTALEYRLELATEASFTTLMESTTVTQTKATLPINLVAGQSYWWRVTAINGCGSTTTAPAPFTVQQMPRVLLVDDDGSSGANDLRPAYAETLAALDVGYAEWDTVNGEMEPTAPDQLADYTTIIWFSGARGSGPSALSEARLAAWLEGGRCLIVSAPDYGEEAGLTPFMQSYLGIGTRHEEQAKGVDWQTVVTGAVGLFAGVGPYPVPVLGAETTVSLTPTAAVQVALDSDHGPVALYQDGSHYRTSYWGVGLERFAPAARTALMTRLLNFCRFQSDLALTQQVTPPTVLRPSQPITYTFNYTNLGVAPALTSTISVSLPAAITAVTVHPASSPASQVSEGSWQLGKLAPGASASLTLIGVISPAMTADTSLTFQATLDTPSYDSALANNTTPVITHTVNVPRWQVATPALSILESSREATVTVALDIANPFGPTTVDYRTSDGSALAGTDYIATAGTLTLAPNMLTTTITIPRLDDRVPEADKTFYLRLQQPRGAALGAITEATITIIDEDQSPTPVPPTPTATKTPTPPTPIPATPAPPAIDPSILFLPWVQR